jgi:hypothetical protein
MKLINVFLSAIAAVLLFASCDRVGGLLAASSAANEVMVIMDERAWQDEAGRALFGVLNSNARALPQPEPNFRILHLTPENFTRTFRTARNVVIPEISNIYSAPALRARLNTYAIGQVILNINAPDTASFVQFVTENKSVIVDYIIEKELERNAHWLMHGSRSGPLTRVQEVFGVNIHPPRGLPNIHEEENFFWATNNAVRARQDLVIYQFPYVTPEIFQKDSLIAIRNRVLGEHIRGAFDSQMTTNTNWYTPHFRTFEVNGAFRAELRGLWEMTTDMMGGPFVMHAFVNENTGMVVVAEVFVFAPESNKRNLIRNMEASLHTINVPQLPDIAGRQR